MSEMALTAQHLIVIGRGRLIADLSVDEFVRRSSKDIVLVRSPQASELRDVLVGPDVTVEVADDGALRVTGLTAEQVGEAAAERGLVLHELTPERATLEEAFMDVTRDDIEYHALAKGEVPKPEEVAA